MKGIEKAAVALTLFAMLAWAPPAWAGDLPDLVISYAKVTMKCNTDGTRTATIFAIVKNQSMKATADLSKNPWHIVLEADWWWTKGDTTHKGTVKPQAGGPKALKLGGIWPATLTITGIKPPDPKKLAKYAKGDKGSYGFQVLADPGNIVAESNEQNNEKLLFVKVGEECDQ